MNRIDERIPTVRKIATDRPDAQAFELCGQITSADVENVYGLLEAAYGSHDTIDLLIRITDYEGVEWNALHLDTTRALETHSLQHIRRYAVVGGPAWLKGAIALFSPFFPMRMRHFDSAEEAEAWAFIDAREIPEDV